MMLLRTIVLLLVPAVSGLVPRLEEPRSMSFTKRLNPDAIVFSRGLLDEQQRTRRAQPQQDKNFCFRLGVTVRCLFPFWFTGPPDPSLWTDTDLDAMHMWCDAESFASSTWAGCQCRLNHCLKCEVCADGAISYDCSNVRVGPCVARDCQGQCVDNTSTPPNLNSPVGMMGIECKYWSPSGNSIYFDGPEVSCEVENFIGGFWETIDLGMIVVCPADFMDYTQCKVGVTFFGCDPVVHGSSCPLDDNCMEADFCISSSPPFVALC